MKREFKNKFKRERQDRVAYTATIDRKTLEHLDSLDGNRSHNIERAIKSYYSLGE